MRQTGDGWVLQSSDAPAIEGSEEESRGAKVDIASTALSSARVVQHLGAWLLVAMLGRLGLHRRAGEIVEERTTSVALRIALDAVAIALAVADRGDPENSDPQGIGREVATDVGLS